MPIYTYECPRCQGRSEEIQRVGEYIPPRCAKCGVLMEHVLSIPAPAVIVETDGKSSERSRSQMERELSEQVQHNELPPHLADAQAKLGGL